MIIMKLKIDNFYGFNDFEMNMSYPRKIVDSTIENEHLKGHSNFRYKKVNIVMGTNASGKTTLGKVIKSIFKFINDKVSSDLFEIIGDRKKDASFYIEFIPDSGKDMYSLEVTCPKDNVKAEKISYKNVTIDGEKIVLKISADYFTYVFKKINILKNDSYETCARRLEQKGKPVKPEHIEKFGWYFTYPLDSMSEKQKDLILKKDNKDVNDNEVFFKILKYVLMTLDNSFIDISRLSDAEKNYIDDAFIIKTVNGDILMQNGKILDEDRLSSGTKSGFDIAQIIKNIYLHKNGFYYCDEKFSFIHSDLEAEILSIMIDNIGYNEQLFFTTHNLELSRLNLPKHSFSFIKKEKKDDKVYTSYVCAGDVLKKNTDSIKFAIDNDVFGNAPELKYLYDLEDELDLLKSDSVVE